jgi:hypothetical protein
VRQAFQGVGGSKFFDRYERLDKSVQIGIICGMTFCAECYPMHIWRGFGSALLDNYNWATYFIENQTWTYLDQSVSFLKSSPRNFSLLKSVPEGIERMKPWVRETEKENNEVSWKAGKKDRKALEAAKKDFNKRLEKKGFPQPVDKSYKISTWSIPYATWDSQFSINNEVHNWANVLRQQMDPGRLFHAFVVGGHLNLREEEVLIVPAGPAECLVRWLEGLEGMTFKLIPLSTLDFKKVGLKSSTTKIMETLHGKDAYAMRDAAAIQRKQTKAAARPVAARPPPPLLTRSPTEGPVPAGVTAKSPVTEKPSYSSAKVSVDQSSSTRLSPKSPPPRYSLSAEHNPTDSKTAIPSPGEEEVAQHNHFQVDLAGAANSGIPPMPYIAPKAAGPPVPIMPAAQSVPPMPSMPGDKRMSMPYMPTQVTTNVSETPENRRASLGPGLSVKRREVSVKVDPIQEVATLS